MRDADLRRALLSQLVSTHWGEEVLLREELGLDHGRVRADVVVSGAELHGYELKSERDTLVRLPSQVEAYSAVFSRCTLVVAESHLSKALPALPPAWGVEVATSVPGGPVQLRTERQAQFNPAQQALAVARLLWRDEALGLLESRGVARGVRGKPRRALYQRLVAELNLTELGAEVRRLLRARGADWTGAGWR